MGVLPERVPMRRFVRLAAALLCLPLAHAARAEAPPPGPPPDPAPLAGFRVVLDAEVGPAYIDLNDGRYGAGGTLFHASELGQQRNLALAKRVSLELGLGRRSTLILLWAPFGVTTEVALPRAIRFRGHLLTAGTVVDAGYLFDGYRASYLYRLVDGRRLKLGIGASFQVRNAAVSFGTVDGTYYDVEPDIGLVFALKARLRYDTPQGLWAMVDADGFSTFGLGNVTGAIYDVALTLGLPFTRGADLFFRLRLVGGGADVPRRDIYNWADFYTATAGVRLDLGRILGRGDG